MKVALIGSVSSSAAALDALIQAGVEVSCVLGLDESKADEVSDYRSLRSQATAAGIAFRSFVKISEPEAMRFLKSHRPDQLWVIGLSQLLPESLLALAPCGGVGFHPTLLPRGRGRAPVAWTILKNEPAAANLFFLSQEPDAGDIIIQRPVPVMPDDYSEDLIERTNRTLHQAILELGPQIRSGRLPRAPQDHSQATYYPKRTPRDGRMDWTQSTDQIYRLVRAAGRPYPGAFTICRGRKLIVWRARPASPHSTGHQSAPSKPGTVLGHDQDGSILVKTGDGTLRLTEIEWQGDEAPAADPIAPGERLGES